MTPDVSAVDAQEPLLTRGAIGTLVAAVITFAVAFGLDLTKDQIIATLGVVSAASPFLVALWARRKVTPSARVVLSTPTVEGDPLVKGEAYRTLL